MPATHSETIVVVDDDEAIRTYLSEILKPSGYKCQTFEDSLSALRWLSAAQSEAGMGTPGMLLSDIALPGMNGMDLLRTVKVTHPHMPIILLSASCDLASATDALSAGATDYLLKPANPDDIRQMVSLHLDHKSNEPLDSAREALRLILSHKLLSGGGRATQLMPIFDLLGLKRFETFQHSRRVAAFALLLGERMHMDEKTLEALEIGSLLHDVGKSGIPFNILMKPGPLDSEERRIMELHPQLGASLLARIPGVELEKQIVLSHHERFDGTGYPEGLTGLSIPLGARLFSIADTLDSITANRCYRKGSDISVARAEILRMSGSQFEPRLVQLFQSIPDRELEEVRARNPDDKTYS
jgi:response regulator RpfG family c-di-GMP phosphodiesterase